MAPALTALAVTVIFLASLAFYWSGIGPADGEHYIAAALAWSEHGPVLGQNHWSLRYPFVLPMAAAFTVFGPSEFAATLPSVFYAAGLVAVTFIFARRYLGAGPGAVAAGLVAVSAFFVDLAIEARVFGAEVFFSSLGCWLFVAGLSEEAKRARRAFAAAGLCVGAAWLCREVIVFLPVSFAITAFWRSRRPVRALIWFSVGFAAVILAELALYAAVASDPLYRYMVDFSHDGATSLADLVAPREGVAAHITKPFANLLTYTVVTPFVVLAALTWLSPGFRRAVRGGPRRDAFAVFATASIANFLIVSYGLDLNQPFYFPLLVYSAFLSLGGFVAHLFATARARLGAALVLAILILNAASADFRQYDEYAETRYLADFALRAEESIATDPLTAIRARTLLRLAGVGEAEAARRIGMLVAPYPPPCGLVYVATPRGATPAITPSPDWRLDWRVKVRTMRWTHRLLRRLGFDHLPSPRLREILTIVEPVARYRAPTCST